MTIKLVYSIVMLLVLLQNKCNHQGDAKKSDDNLATLQKLFERYERGEIERCEFKGSVVYKAGLNAPDAGSVIFDYDGNKIGSCNYGWGPPDSMCQALQNCSDVYRVAENTWDKPAVNKYNLKR